VLRLEEFEREITVEAEGEERHDQRDNRRDQEQPAFLHFLYCFPGPMGECYAAAGLLRRTGWSSRQKMLIIGTAP